MLAVTSERRRTSNFVAILLAVATYNIAYTNNMKRWLALLLLTLLGIASIQVPSAHAAVNNFRISTYTIDYHLSKDTVGRSLLSTKETITAEFPPYDQNHGIERAIPQKYDGHKVQLSIQSITDLTGTKLPYSTYETNDNLVLRIGDKNTYVHGTQTYVISYTQHDVTKFFKNVGRDEFYWDTNGIEWQVPIDSLVVGLTIDPSFQSNITGDTACYQGVSKSTSRCTITRTETGYQIQAANLRATENITLAVGFTKGTFTPYQKTLFEKILWLVLMGWLLSLPVIVISSIVLIVRYRRWGYRSSERQIVVPEYLPPKDISIATAAALIRGERSVFTAQLLDFAVRHYIQIIQTKEKRFWSPAEYDIEIMKDISALKSEEQEILKDIFGSTEVGQRLSLKSLRNNTTVYNRMLNNPKQLQQLMRGEYALTAKDTAKSAWFKKAGVVLLVIALLTLNPGVLLVAVSSFIASYTLWPLTDRGLELSKYLDGLKQYISVAEADRLKQLQSPEGALKVGKVDVTDTAQLVKLYEKVLPYAALFGLEKGWNKQIGQYYESIGKNPDWYSGQGSFNAAAFSVGMSSFSASAGYSSASSSSSGGSGGGGSSGGGGGGGGGGGW